jgi:hypothetical protein
MSEEAATGPERPPAESLPAALHVKRNVLIGLAVGGILALSAYLIRVFELLGPFAGTREFPVLGVGGWYLMLAFVLATATAMLVAAVLTLGSALWLALTTPAEGERPE